MENNGFTPENAVCANCGTPLSAEQAFCPACGTPKAAPQPQPQPTFCGKCGTPLAEGQAFCPACGQKAGLVVDANVGAAIDQFNAGVTQQKKKPMKALIAAIIAVAVILVGVLVAPKLIVTVEGLCEQGKYIEAYEKAEGAEKDSVLAENVIAYLSDKSSDKMKDPSSYVLREGYYYCFVRDDGTFGQQVALYVSGNNSYGAAVSNYWVWVYDNTDEAWEFWGTAQNTQTSSDDELEDLLVKIVLESVMEHGIQLQKSQVKNINAQFEKDTLYTVALIPKSDIDISRFPAG